MKKEEKEGNNRAVTRENNKVERTNKRCGRERTWKAEENKKKR